MLANEAISVVNDCKAWSVGETGKGKVSNKAFSEPPGSRTSSVKTPERAIKPPEPVGCEGGATKPNRKHATQMSTLASFDN